MATTTRTFPTMNNVLFNVSSMDVGLVVPSCSNYEQIHTWEMTGMHLAKKFEVLYRTSSRMSQSVVARRSGRW